MIRVSVSAALLFVLACNRAPAQDASMVTSSDPELRRVAEEILPELARRSGLELKAPVRVERRTRDQLQSYLRFKLDQEMPPERAESIARVYRLLGLLPQELDLRELLLSVYMEQVAGFYDPDSTALFVMDDQPVQAMESLLVHELVHAIQDQTTRLDSITDSERGNDRQLAAQAAVEGHATLVMLEYAAAQVQGSEVDLTTIPNFPQAIRPALQAMAAQFPALASAPALLQESLLFPYLEGVGFVQALWKEREGRPVPFGENLPGSTEQILHPERFLRLGDQPSEVTLRLPDGPEILYSNTLGELELAVLLEEHLGAGARRLSRGWDGDAFALTAAADGSHGLSWAVVWDDAERRDAFVAAFGRVVPSLGSAAFLEVREVDGRPVSVLHIGGPVRVVVDLPPSP